jgi:hypothetical protein
MSLKSITVLLITFASVQNITSAQERESLPVTLFSWNGDRESLGELEPISTDRPSFTEAVSTVGKGVAQLETGYTFYRNGDSQAHSWGEPLLRYGALYNWLELRIAFLPVTEYAGNSSISYPGINDFYFGSKVALTKQDGILPQTALIGQCIIPAGFGTVPGNTWLPGINYLYGWDLNEKIKLTGSSQLDRAAETDVSQYLEVAQSGNLKFELSEKVSTFTEFFALLPHSAHEKRPEYYFDCGLQFQISEDAQADMRIGTGLNAEADNLFAGGGLSFRFH